MKFFVSSVSNIPLFPSNLYFRACFPLLPTLPHIKYLTENYKLSPKRLSAVGYGEYAPIYDNTTNKGREKNRRVDIIILDNKIKKEVKE